MIKPLISVVIPLYNKENSILATVNSVLNQSFEDFELLIIDDGSTDKSIQVISALKDNRLRVLSKSNGGVSDARNYGIKFSKGEFIFFLDADDLLLNDCLSTFSNLIDNYSSISVFVANFKIIKGSSEKIYCSYLKEGVVKSPLKSLWEKKIFPRTGAMLINKKCFEKTGFFRTDITVYEDLDFSIKLLKNFKIVSTPNIVLAYQLEHNYLSQKIYPLKKELSYYLNLKDKSFFEKLILAENILSAYNKRVKLKDYEAKKYLFNKNKKYLFFFIVAKVYRRVLQAKFK